MSDERAHELVAVDLALNNLAAVDPRKSKVFELRYFGGMSVDEAVANGPDDWPGFAPTPKALKAAWKRRSVVD
jgi:ECF sigma factor